MGYLSALGMAEATDLDSALRWHLAHNHYPAVPATLVRPCREAIEAFGDEDEQQPIDLPEGVSWKGHDWAPAWAIVDQHHLDAFL